ncbi:D-2-hydroxyglutarate dehydrogenase, mitochondrial-like isoform X1 [Amyelois transitella]|uniref:D-2-hydroxyglutarate dehydrogenase, mitochondrial-like isoform X1 n=1 Tax=Amyelois transitella TaxID=680683 RepID=UPI00298FF5CA|nr:D-2-hydroxyglutarate dehydrogenase, mitochondrial-like isoform X1 [Amyelois transitella]
MFKSVKLILRSVPFHSYDQYRCATQVLPQLSSEKYKLVRKNYARVQDIDLNYFKSILDENRVITNESDLLPYNIDWVKNCRGQSKVVLKPSSVHEVSQILSYCNEKRLAVCPQGGNTSVVGGSVPVFDEIILNMTNLNKILSLDDISGALVCEAGCILETLDNFVRDQGLIMPLDLGAKGTCHIGGNVSTNAGGLRLVRYGNLHGSVLGLEAVKADGSIVDCLKSLKKDNTGYHLKHLFIGSEGTLGVVTKVAIHCPSMPKAVTIGLFGVNSFDDVLNLYKNAKASLGEIISAFEMSDHEAINGSAKYLNRRLPIPEYPYYVIIETHGSNEAHDEEKLSMFLKKEMESGLILDGTVTSETKKMQHIWSFRESVPAADMNNSYLYAYDVSLPHKHYYELVPILRKRLGDKVLRVSGFGHIGDGNVHINIVTPKYSQEVTDIVEPFIFEEVAKRQGSVSAEHGMGLKKPHYMHFSKDQSAIELMKVLKQLMDPNGILNPYKVLPEH